MAERNREFLQILARQMGQRAQVDRVVGEQLGILAELQARQPLGHIAHGRLPR